jgi:NDP-sugar pyrophosphorylase family protein
VTGFILAAGLGTRLRLITDHIPKALVPAAGIPLLSRSLGQMHRAGITRIGVNAHHRAEMLADFRASSAIDFSLFHEEGAVRGTGGAFWFARAFLGSEETFCVSNVYIIASLDYQTLMARFLTSSADCALVAVSAAGKGSIFYDPSTFEYAGLSKAGPSMAGARPAEFVGTAFYRRRFLETINEKDFSIVPAWTRAQEQELSVKVLIEEGL